jgi:endogenous inhibitor of DNA gyrase (YacG/DUF329 family)
MGYKQKTCPRCNTVHNKRGPFCSRSCGNVREHTEEDKKIRRKKLLEYNQTPEGIATQEKSRRQMIAYNKGEEYNSVSADDFAVDIPDVTDYNMEYDSTWQRAEKW